MRVSFDVGHGVDGTRGQLVRFDNCQILGERARADRLTDRPIELETVNHTRFVGAEPWIGEHSVEAICAQEAFRHLGRRSAHRDPAAIVRAIAASRARVLRAAAVTRSGFAERRVLGRQRPQERKQRFEQREIDDLPGSAVYIAVVQGKHDRVDRVEGGRRVGERKPRHDRRTVGIAIHRGKTARGFDQRAESGARGARPGLAPPRDAEDNEAGMAGVENLRTQS